MSDNDKQEVGNIIICHPKNQVTNIIIGRAEFRDLIQFLDCPSCAARQIKASGDTIKIQTEEGKYFSVDNILKYHIIKY